LTGRSRDGSPRETTAKTGELASYGHLDDGEFRRRASAGVFLTAGWSSVNLAVAFLGNIVLARLLTPRDFGIFAIGATVLLLVGAISDGGLAAGLLRRPAVPDRSELRNLLGVNLAFTIPIAAAGFLIAPQLSAAGLAVAVMLLGLPLGALQSPARLMFNRELLFQRIGIIDAAGIVAFYGWTITGAGLGFGVWALATGSLMRISVSAILAVTLSPYRVIVPSLAGARRLFPIFRFGLTFQAQYITAVVRDQGLNVTIAMIGGIATLGLWSLVYRVMQAPLVLFESALRVAFPAMSRFLADKRDPAPLIERSLRISGVAAALVMATLGAAGPQLIPTVFGEQWRAASLLFSVACLAMLVSGPASASMVGYLCAAARPGIVVRAAIACAVVWIATAAALLPVVGVVAVGIGWVLGAVIDAAILGVAVKRLTGSRVFHHLVPPVAVGTCAMAVGWLVTRTGPDTALTGAAGALTAAVLVVLLMRGLRPGAVSEMIGFAGDSMSAATRAGHRQADRTAPGYRAV